MNISAQGWQDLLLVHPVDPRSFLLYASVAGTGPGVFGLSTSFLQTTWGTNPIALTGNNTFITTTDTTDALKIAEAQQWSFAHQMANASAALGPAMKKVVFLRSGSSWQNNVEIGFGAANYTNVQLSLRDNLGTSGSFLNGSAGAVPVVTFSGTLTGNLILHLVILQPGTYSMVLVVNNAGTWSTFEMEWIVIL